MTQQPQNLVHVFLAKLSFFFVLNIFYPDVWESNIFQEKEHWNERINQGSP